MNPGIKYSFTLLLLVSDIVGNAQSPTILGQNISNSSNPVTTAVPFLLIPPDARADGMGDAGVASSPDVNSTHWNPAKLAFIKDTIGISGSYTPWLRQLMPDINLAYFSGFCKLHNGQTIGASIRDFTLGNIEFTGPGVTIGNTNPFEYAIDLTYARQLSSLWSLAISARYVYSNLAGASPVIGIYQYPGKTFGADISSYYQSKDIPIGKTKSLLSAGICISNIGPKISYSNSASPDFIPTNLRLGGAYSMQIDLLNKLSFLLDMNKLLLPTPPIYSLNPGQPNIQSGYDPNVGVFQGMIQSFYDAPGGFKEELDEINLSSGIEYVYAGQFAFRTGLFYENPTKGGREYFSMGAGFKLKILTIDAAYLIPISQQNPLQNTLCISLGFYIR